jgi:hypothetical protein
MAVISPKWLAAGSAVLVLLVLGMSALTFPGRSAAQVPETFTVTSTTQKLRFIDAPGRPPGDYLVLRLVLRGETGSAIVGAEVDHCLFVFNQRQLCDSVFNINGRGRLIAEGIWNPVPGKTNVFAVTGGTGDFTGAGGTARFEDLGNGRIRITFDLIT